MVDRDRVRGAAKQKTGELKKAAGKALGDEKLKHAGRSEALRGKAQNTVGGARESLRERTSRGSS